MNGSTPTGFAVDVDTSWGLMLSPRPCCGLSDPIKFIMVMDAGETLLPLDVGRVSEGVTDAA
jgi:hypothetical protein